MSEPGRLDFVHVAERILRKEFASVAQRIHMPLDLKIENVTTPLVDAVGEMAYLLSGYVWAEEIQNETVAFRAEYPATWWQHFKKDCFPAWALRRWPVLTEKIAKEHTFKTIALLPEFRYHAPPGCGRHVIKTQVTP